MTTPQQTAQAPTAPVDPQVKILEHLASIRTAVNVIATVVVLGALGAVVELIVSSQS